MGSVKVVRSLECKRCAHTAWEPRQTVPRCEPPMNCSPNQCARGDRCVEVLSARVAGYDS